MIMTGLNEGLGPPGGCAHNLVDREQPGKPQSLPPPMAISVSGKLPFPIPTLYYAARL